MSFYWTTVKYLKLQSQHNLMILKKHTVGLLSNTIQIKTQETIYQKVSLKKLLRFMKFLLILKKEKIMITNSNNNLKEHVPPVGPDL